MGKKFRILAFIPMLIMMGVIWGFSANSGEESSVLAVTQCRNSHIGTAGSIEIHSDRFNKFLPLERAFSCFGKVAEKGSCMVFAPVISQKQIRFRHGTQHLAKGRFLVTGDLAKAFQRAMLL